MSNTSISRRGSTFYFRARIPTKFIAAYGRSMVSVSLHTTDKAEAKLRARAKRADLDRELEALGQPSSKPLQGFRGTLLTLTDADVEHICLRYRADRLSNDEDERVAGIDAENHQLDLDILLDGTRLLRENFAHGRLANVYHGLNAHLQEIDVRVPRGTPPYERLARRFQEAEIEVYEAILRRRQGHVVSIPSAPLEGLTFEAIFKAWHKRKASRPLKTVRAFEQAFESLAVHCTTTTPMMLQKPHVAALRDEMIARGNMSRRTVQKLLQFLQAAFQCVVDDGLLQLNPFVGIKVAIDESASNEKARLPFSAQQLKAIFSGPIYQEGFIPRDSLGNACHWLPLLSLFTAGRLEELAQLHAEDIQEHPDLGWYILIHAGGKRQLKNASSVRDIPLHSELIKLGFLDLVAKTKQGPLFPALRRDKYRKLTTSYSTWFGLYLDKLAIQSPQLVFHSLRHNFIQRCKEKVNVIPAEIREAIAGHISPKDIRAQYGVGKYPIEPMVPAMTHVEYRELDLSHLYKQAS